MIVYISCVSVFTAVCPVHGEEDPVVCLLGWPRDSVIRRPWHWSAYLPPLSGESLFVKTRNHQPSHNDDITSSHVHPVTDVKVCL